MDYAMEYALMSDIYDDLTGVTTEPAQEGLFGIDNIIDMFIKLIVRLIRRLGEFLAKKLNIKIDPTKEDQRMRSHAQKYVNIINSDLKYMHYTMKKFTFGSDRTEVNGKGVWYTHVRDSDPDDFQKRLDKLSDIFLSFGRNYIKFDKVGEDDEADRSMLRYWNNMVLAQVDRNLISELKKCCENSLKYCDAVKQQFYKNADVAPGVQQLAYDHIKKAIDCVNIMNKYIYALEHPKRVD